MLLSIIDFIGRFHPLLVHLPIGILLTGLFLQWLSAKERYKISPEVIKIILLAGMLSAIFTCITGYMLSLSGDYEGDLVSWHMWMGIAVAIASIILFIKVANKSYDLSHKLASFALLALIVITGHLGGTLTHGAGYLSLSIITASDSVIVNQKPIKNIQEAKLYEDIIQPLMAAKCISCHGPHKQKGGLRLDDSLFCIRGGKDGAVIIPGSSEKSEIVKRIVLPKETDHHMPPREKPQLTDREIAIIRWWIDGGSGFSKKIKELPQPETIKPVLLSFQNNSQEHKAPSMLPDHPVEAGDAKAIAKLKDEGVTVIPVSQGSNYLLADFVTAPGANDAAVQHLTKLNKQLIWLKAGGLKITDKALSYISQCTNLTELDLNNTPITDEGLSYLKSLEKLQLLNLVGTKITARGLSKIGSRKTLHSLYIYKTQVESKDIPGLHKLFPASTLDTGGYRIPFLDTDTMIVRQKKITK